MECVDAEIGAIGIDAAASQDVVAGSAADAVASGSASESKDGPERTDAESIEGKKEEVDTTSAESQKDEDDSATVEGAPALATADATGDSQHADATEQAIGIVDAEEHLVQHGGSHGELVRSNSRRDVRHRRTGRGSVDAGRPPSRSPLQAPPPFRRQGTLPVRRSHRGGNLGVSTGDSEQRHPRHGSVATHVSGTTSRASERFGSLAGSWMPPPSMSRAMAPSAAHDEALPRHSQGLLGSRKYSARLPGTATAAAGRRRSSTQIRPGSLVLDSEGLFGKSPSGSAGVGQAMQQATQQAMLASAIAGAATTAGSSKLNSSQRRSSRDRLASSSHRVQYRAVTVPPPPDEALVAAMAAQHVRMVLDGPGRESGSDDSSARRSRLRAAGQQPGSASSRNEGFVARDAVGIAERQQQLQQQHRGTRATDSEGGSSKGKERQADGTVLQVPSSQGTSQGTSQGAGYDKKLRPLPLVPAISDPGLPPVDTPQGSSTADGGIPRPFSDASAERLESDYGDAYPRRAPSDGT